MVVQLILVNPTENKCIRNCSMLEMYSHVEMYRGHRVVNSAKFKLFSIFLLQPEHVWLCSFTRSASIRRLTPERFPIISAIGIVPRLLSTPLPFSTHETREKAERVDVGVSHHWNP